MQSKMCIRVPLKMPHQTFGEAFSSDNLTFDNIQTGYFMILSGNRVGEETGTAKITVDGIRKDGTVIEGIPFSKKQDDIFKYTEVTEDEIKIEDCPVWLEYMITSRMVTSMNFNFSKIRFKNILDIEELNINEHSVAIVGKSGGGKSTLLRIMANIISLDSGDFFIDDKNIADYNPVTFRRLVTLMNQKPIIYSGSIKDNLIIGLIYQRLIKKNSVKFNIRLGGKSGYRS